MKKLKIILPVITAALTCIAIFMGIQYAKELKQYKVSEEEYKTLVKEATENKRKVVTTYVGNAATPSVQVDPTAVTYDLPELSVNFRKLIEQNRDCIAWIYIPSVDISYPVVQSVDNDDYVKRTFNGTENPAGCIFSDCRITAPFVQKTILYGHNMKNGSMFHNLMKIETHPGEYKDIWIYLPSGAIYHYVVDQVLRTDRLDKEVYSISATYDDTLVLSTCIKDETRLVVIAKRDWAYA